MDDLKKCPFCRGEAELLNGYYDNGIWGVYCTKCGRYAPSSFDVDTKESAIEAWNCHADDGWISVKDRLPNVDKTQSQYEHVTVIAATERSVFPLVYERTIVRKKVVYRWMWLWGTIYNFNDITHWRPLPELPKEE